MNFPNKTQDEEMSMEDILSSIRKYVAEEDTKYAEKSSARTQEKLRDCQYSPDTGNTITLDEGDVISAEEPAGLPEIADNPNIYREVSTLSQNVAPAPTEELKRGSPFEQLANALNSYGKREKKQPSSSEEKKSFETMTAHQLLASLAEVFIKQWIDTNLGQIVETMVLQEIEKIKSE
ncbi:MAG: DUF2497 domain-containing protein [Holosporales bacterium]|jgi:cell pole-organizing protein PopZ|nr:DUF2497 domain-containing protein [Holosporales bacterium]